MQDFEPDSVADSGSASVSDSNTDSDSGSASVFDYNTDSDYGFASDSDSNTDSDYGSASDSDSDFLPPAAVFRRHITEAKYFQVMVYVIMLPSCVV